MRSILAVVLLLSLALPLGAKQKQPLYAPVSRVVIAAKSIYLDNQTGNPQGADNAYTQLKEWGRFTFVEDPKLADIIIRVRLTSSTSDGVFAVPMGTGIIAAPVRSTHMFTNISLIDQNSTVVWTATAPWSKKHPATKEIIKELRLRIDAQEKEAKQ